MSAIRRNYVGKQILSGPDVLPKLLKGVNLIADAVKATLGPQGRNCVYERIQTNQPVSTRDGVTVANQMDSDDPYERIAIELIKGVAREAVDQSGDGTTTATLLAQAIFAEGVKAVGVGGNPVAIKRGIERAAAAVIAALKTMARPVEGDQLRAVATISANNDEFLGGLIASAMEKAGDDGVVTVEISRSPESSLQIVDGMQFGTGMLSPAFITNPERNECVLEDVYILFHEKKLTSILPMKALMEKLVSERKSLLVIAEDVTDEALGILAINAERKLFKTCAVKTPGGLDHLQDIAALAHGTIITELSGIKLSTITEQHLGRAAKVIVKPTTTTIVASSGDNLQLDTRLRTLRTQVTEAGNEADRMRLQARLARLAGGIAVIRVGGVTEPEMLERKDRIEDAMHAARCAKSEGVVPGGGIALLQAGRSVEMLEVDKELLSGASIVTQACLAPIITLATNSGKSPEYIIEKIQNADSANFGWNARADTYGNMIEMGILDPLRVVRVALETAASVAGLLLITHCLVSNGRDK
jgi:chaperonin GroEL